MQVTRCAALALAVTLLSACAEMRPRAQYAEAADAFGKSVAAASETLAKQTGDAERVVRMLAVQKYVREGDDTLNLNAAPLRMARQARAAKPAPVDERAAEQARTQALTEDATAVVADFARFACAGVDMTLVQKAQLAHLKRFAGALSDASKESPKELGELWSAIEALREQKGPLPFQDPDGAKQSDACRKEAETLAAAPFLTLALAQEAQVTDLLKLVPGYKEFAQVLDIMKSIAAAGLRIEYDRAQKQAFRRAVEANRDSIRMMLNDAALNMAANRRFMLRKKASLVVPFARFQDMLLLDRYRDQIRILEAAEKLHADLKEFDELRRLRPPAGLAQALLKAFDRVDKVATDDDISLGEAIAYLEGITRELEAIRDELEKLKD